ncbi:MAG: uracil-DNA glycosylase [Candidatus Pacebacteria bacterium]|nr:uracil-DNA glycosylase [Candidatus Paceibacterota bacterium]
MPNPLSSNPPHDCPLCPRLVEFRNYQQSRYPNAHNQPVAEFGDPDGRLLIVGLAPGQRGANSTGRPFTGDYAGKVLYPALLKFGFARGVFAENADDGLELIDCRITNAVRCLPPQNRPTAAEINQCRPFLKASIGTSDRLRVILALGRIAHESVLRCHGHSLAGHPFVHGQNHVIDDKLTLVDSYHCSQYNIFTRRLSVEQFESIVSHCNLILKNII